METVQQDILIDIEPQLVRASTGKRLANYLIDFVVFLIVVFILAIIIAMVSPPSSDESGLISDNSLLERLFWMFMYGAYMAIIEGIFKGRSIGKFITGTKAVNEDGSNISFTTAIARGFSRIVPFEPFSALGSPSYPWHDKWNKTYVIDIRNSSLK
jgi:uncharacterized RDD family membrane protein YckC